MSVFLLLNTKDDVLKSEQLTAPIDFYTTGKNTMEVNGYRQLFGL